MVELGTHPNIMSKICSLCLKARPEIEDQLGLVIDTEPGGDE